MVEDILAVRSPPSLPIEVWQLVMNAVWAATTHATFYFNDADYRSWALVSRAWCTCAQAVLFRTVELDSAAHLRRFAALLSTAPHLAVYVNIIRVYSTDLHTHNNVLALLPSVLPGDVLPNFWCLTVRRITKCDAWHPRAPRTEHQHSDRELAYMPLPLDRHPDTDAADSPCANGGEGFLQGLEAHFTGLSELHLSNATFETFDALAQTLHALPNLRMLFCIGVRWRALGDLPECLVRKNKGKRRRQGQEQGFLPKLRDLRILYMDLHGVEWLLAALARPAALERLYVDCPHYCPVTFFHPPSADPATGTPVGIDLRAFSGLGTLWLCLPYTLSECRELPDMVATLLHTWTSATEGANMPRKLTLTPSSESGFTRAEFADVLRALAPVIEDVLGELPLQRENEDGNKAEESDTDGWNRASVIVDVCVVEQAGMREWWREAARESFVRLYARGRLHSSFEKPFWPEAQWHDAEDTLLGGGPGPAGGGQIVVVPENNAPEGGGHVSNGMMRWIRGSSRFTGFRPLSWKKGFHAVRRSLS